MKITVLKVCVAFAAVMLTGAAFAHADKFIANGWQFAHRPVDLLLKDAEAMKNAPINGCTLYLVAPTKEGYEMSSARLIDQPAWKYEYLVPQIEKYRKLFTYPQFKYCFLNSYRAPRQRVAWTNDAAWAKIANNMRVSAKFAKACGFIGLQMDPEDYHAQHQYDYKPEDAPTYAQAAALARQRGRQVFKGVFEEFPDAKVLSYWLVSMESAYMSCVDGRLLSKYRDAVGVDLWSHFLDGILDVVSPEAILIDGLEHAYTWKASDYAYFRGAAMVHQNFEQVVAPENREKYRKQVQNSFGIYLDGYSTITNQSSSWYMQAVNGSRVNHLKLNLLQAKTCANEFLWLWGERGTWAKPDLNGKDWQAGWVNWEAAMPGLSAAILAMRDPIGGGKILREQLEQAGAKPVFDNVACAGEGAALPKPYTSWQDLAKYGFIQGKFGRDDQVGFGDKSSVYAEGVGSGCINLPFVRDAKAGDVYVLSFRSKGRSVSASIGWVKNGKWDWTNPRMVIPVTAAADAEGWKLTDWAFVLPEGAEGFGVMLSVRQTAGERTWFDDVKVYKAD